MQLSNYLHCWFLLLLPVVVNGKQNRERKKKERKKLQQRKAKRGKQFYSSRERGGERKGIKETCYIPAEKAGRGRKKERNTGDLGILHGQAVNGQRYANVCTRISRGQPLMAVMRKEWKGMERNGKAGSGE